MGDLRGSIYKFFEENNVTTREELREIVRKKEVRLPIDNTSILEGFWKEYKSKDKEQVKQLKVVTINDVHVPFQNNEMIKNFISLLEDEQPDVIILNGDMVDFYDLSSFDKDPSRQDNLQDELDTLYRMLLVIRGACPEAEIVYVEGNHEDRLRRYLWKQAPALNSLRSLKLEVLLNLDALGIKLVKKHFIKGFMFAHGKVVRTHSSYSAKAEFESRGCSGISGHTHRMGSHCKTNATGTFGWWENGCGCELTPEYVELITMEV